MVAKSKEGLGPTCEGRRRVERNGSTRTAEWILPRRIAQICDDESVELNPKTETKVSSWGWSANIRFRVCILVRQQRTQLTLRMHTTDAERVQLAHPKRPALRRHAAARAPPPCAQSSTPASLSRRVAVRDRPYVISGNEQQMRAHRRIADDPQQSLDALFSSRAAPSCSFRSAMVLVSRSTTA